jgi:hypothetical protein
MAANRSDSPLERGRNLEEEFFRRNDELLLQKLREKQAAETAREALSKATGITKPEVLDRLIALEVRPEMATALMIVPLVEVAWADGSIDAKEREAILAQARVSNLEAGSPELALLESWLQQRPGPKLLAAWTLTIQDLVQKLEPAEIEKLKSGLVGRARGVAKASGGVLGIGKVSSKEEAVLARLESAFPATK